MSLFMAMAHEAGNSQSQLEIKHESIPVPRLVLRTELPQFATVNSELEPIKGNSDNVSNMEDREMLVNTIEVSTEELIDTGHINSDEIEYIYSSNIVEPCVAINESHNIDNEICEIEPIESALASHQVDHDDSKIGLDQLASCISESEKEKSKKLKIIETSKESRNFFVQNGNEKGSRKVIVSNTSTKFRHKSATTCATSSSSINDEVGVSNANGAVLLTPMCPQQLDNLIFSTIGGKRITLESGSKAYELSTPTQQLTANLKNVDKHERLVASSNEKSFSMGTQLPTILEAAAVAHQAVTADLNSQGILVSQDPNQNIGPNHKKPVTVKIEVPGGSHIQLHKFYCQPGLCRVCLLVKENLSSIFEDVSIDSNGLIENSRGPNAAHKFNLIPVLKTLLDIEVEYNDGLSDLICSDCYDQLMNFSVYRKRIAIGQTRLEQILDHVKNYTSPTLIPPLGEADMQKTEIYRHAPLIVTANKMIKNSQYSHLVLRNLSDRTWDKIFMLMSSMIGYNSGKLKDLAAYATDFPYVIGFFCYSCNSTIHGSKDDYAKHYKSFHGIKSSTDVNFPCDVCGNNYPLVSGTCQSYSEHWLQHFFSHECDVCNKKLPSSRGLWIHKKSAHARKKGSFTCDEENCNKTFNKNSLLAHHKLKHKNYIITPNQTHNQSSTWTSYEEACEKRENTCSPLNVEHLWSCDECQSKFNRQNLLLEHKAKVHVEFGCKECGKTFKNLDAQKMHNSLHEAQNRLTCKICNKICLSVHGLKSHMVTHQDWGDFPCPDCGKVFKRAGSLTDHKRIHTGETPFACSLCDKSFRMKSNYFKHMRIHKIKEQKKNKPH